MKVWHPDHPDVAAALEQYQMARAALADHVAGCAECMEHDALTYNRCATGHQLAMERIARKVRAQAADAKVSAPGPARGGQRP